MSDRYVVIPVSWTRGYVKDTFSDKKIGNDMMLEKAHEYARNLNLVNEMKGAK